MIQKTKTPFIFKFLLILALSLSSLFAVQKETLKEEMKVEITKVQDILKNKELNKIEKKENIIKIIDKLFDYRIMGQIALGKKGKTISKEQKTNFLKLFENRLKNSYIEKLDLYTDEEVIIKDVLPFKKTRLILKSDIIGKDATYSTNYKFYNNKRKKQWLIYDVEIEGVSIIQTYRQQFAGLLREKSFDELLKTLEEQK